MKSNNCPKIALTTTQLDSDDGFNMTEKTTLLNLRKKSHQLLF